MKLEIGTTVEIQRSDGRFVLYYVLIHLGLPHQLQIPSMS